MRSTPLTHDRAIVVPVKRDAGLLAAIARGGNVQQPKHLVQEGKELIDAAGDHRRGPAGLE
jgi:hypothetical protein